MILSGFNTITLGTSTISVNGTSVGATYDINTNDQIKYYIVEGSPTLSTSLAFTNSAPIPGQVFVFLWGGAPILGANNITFFGSQLSDEQALVNQFLVAYYDNSAFKTITIPSWLGANLITSLMLQPLSVTDAKINDVSGTKISAGTIPSGAYGALSILTAAIGNAQITTSKIAPLAIDNTLLALLSVATGNIQSSAVTGAKIAAATIDASKFTASAGVETIVVPVSFEAGEQSYNQIRVPYNGILTLVDGMVTKAIANTDAAGVATWISTNYGTLGVVVGTGNISFPLSSAVNTVNQTTTTTNNILSNAPDNFITVQSQKTTPGGKALITLTIQRS